MLNVRLRMRFKRIFRAGLTGCGNFARVA